METFLYLALGIAVGLAVGFLLGKSLSRNTGNESELAAMNARNEELKIQVLKADEERAERRKRDEEEQLLIRELAPL